MVNRNLIKSGITAIQSPVTGLTARMCNAVKWLTERNLIKSSITAVQNQATGLTVRMYNAVKLLTGTCSNPALQQFRAKQEGCKPEYARQ